MKRPFWLMLTLSSSLFLLTWFIYRLGHTAVAAPLTDFPLIVNYDAETVSLEYAAGTDVTLTITDPAGIVKATAQIRTRADGAAPGVDGYLTSHADWFPEPPNIEPNDQVTAVIPATSESSSLQVGSIIGNLDIVNDRIIVSINAPWLPPATPLVTQCHPWGGSGASSIIFQILPNGTDVHTCAWDPVSEWNIQPGQEVTIEYIQSDGNRVLHAFTEPAAALHIEHYPLGTPAANGNLPLKIIYSNNGDAPADNVQLTNVLLVGLNYITDTAGVPHNEITPGVHTWNLGTIPARSEGEFFVYAQVSAGLSQSLESTVNITTTTSYNSSPTSDLFHLWGNVVHGNDSWLSVNKWANPSDPAAGQTTIYNIDICNNGATSSDWVTLDEFLPPELNYLSWSTTSPGWQEVSHNNNFLRLQKPSLSSYGCETVNVQVVVMSNIAPGSMLVNTAVISATSDLSPGDNQTIYTHYTAPPYANLLIHHNWESGQIVPGGLLQYHLSYGNNGNLPTALTHITQTIPNITQFVTAWTNPPYGHSLPITPTQINGNQLIWDMGLLAAGQNGDIIVQLSIAANATPGTPLSQTVAIGSPTPEPFLDDNISTSSDLLYPLGPNLRIVKSGYWYQNEIGNHAQYHLNIENIGSHQLYNVTVTDTYPLEMFLGSGFRYDGGRLLGWQDYASAHFFTATFSYLGPGETTWIDFDSYVTSAPTQTTHYTNTAYIDTRLGDPSPEDNVSQLPLSFTLPDPFVEKRANSCCGLQPSVPLRYEVEYGNLGHNDALDVLVWDVLPPEVTFVDASIPPSSQTGNYIEWYFPSLPADFHHTLYVTTTINAGVPQTATLVNEVNISNSNGDEDSSNNTATNLFYGLADLEVQKTADTQAVQLNQLVTYVITLTNHGPDTATDVFLNDYLPPEATFVSVTSNLGVITCASGVVIQCYTPTLPVNTPAVINLIVQASQPGQATNYAMATSLEDDPTPTDNIAQASVWFITTNQPTVVAVTPDGAANNQPTPLNMQGFNFQPGAVAYLSRLQTSTPLNNVVFVNSNTLLGVVPAGLTPGTYDLVVQNSDGRTGQLLNAFTVYTNAAPVVTAVSPTTGPNNLPVTLDIYGHNFAPQANAILQQALLPFPLSGVELIDHGHIRATIPISLTPGSYDVVVINPNATHGDLPVAYTVLDSHTYDDLLAYDADFGSQPASPRQNQSTTLSLRLFRMGGQTDLINVPVSFYDGPPGIPGGTLIGQTIIPLLPPNGQVPISTTWTPLSDGLHTLYAVIDPDLVITETDESNNQVQQQVWVRPSSGDTHPPQVNTLTINNGDPQTNQRQVTLDVHASDNTTLSHLLYIEYIFFQSNNTWVPIQASGWLTYTGAYSGYNWLLQPWPGAHYLQAWVIDDAGNISLTPGEAIINFLPTVDIPITHGQGHIFRWHFTAGQSWLVRLTSLSGDADLYVWDFHDQLLGSSENEAGIPIDEVSFTVPADGLYQIEVTGADEALYRLEIIPTSSAPIVSPEGIFSHVKGRGSPYSVIVNGPSPTPALPLPPDFVNHLFLPVIIRP